MLRYNLVTTPSFKNFLDLSSTIQRLVTRMKSSSAFNVQASGLQDLTQPKDLV